MSKKFSSCENYLSLDEIRQLSDVCRERIPDDSGIIHMLDSQNRFFRLGFQIHGISLGYTRKLRSLPKRYRTLMLYCCCKRYLAENFGG